MNIKDEAVEAAKRIRDTAMQQTVAARIPESGHFGAIAQDADWLVDHLTAALPHMGGVMGAWSDMGEIPEIGSKFIALYDDGSGAALFFKHDDGFIDSDGDDFSELGSNFGCWAYLPSGFDLWCENAPEPVRLPYWHGPALASHEPAPEPAKDGPEVVERLRKWCSETINQWSDEYDPRENWERQVSGAMREWDKATTEIISDYEALRAVAKAECLAFKALREGDKMRADKAEARVAELEKALERFDPQVIGSGPSTDMAMLHDAQMLARAALKGQSNEA